MLRKQKPITKGIRGKKGVSIFDGNHKGAFNYESLVNVMCIAVISDEGKTLELFPRVLDAQTYISETLEKGSSWYMRLMIVAGNAKNRWFAAQAFKDWSVLPEETIKNFDKWVSRKYGSQYRLLPITDRLTRHGETVDYYLLHNFHKACIVREDREKDAIYLMWEIIPL